MAWAAPKQLPSFHEIAHLDPDTLKFVVLLRQSEHEDEWIKSLPIEQQKVILEEKKKDGKKAPCTRKDCKVIEMCVSCALIERTQILENINKLKLILQDSDEISKENQARLQESTSIQRSLELQLDGLSKAKNDLFTKTKNFFQERRTLDLQIKEAQRDMASVMEPTESLLPEKSDFISSEFISSKKLSNQKKAKHTGSYRYSSTGTMQWSCCLQTNFNADGCSDDVSLDMRSTMLLRNKEQYKPHEFSNALSNLQSSSIYMNTSPLKSKSFNRSMSECFPRTMSNKLDNQQSQFLLPPKTSSRPSTSHRNELSRSHVSTGELVKISNDFINQRGLSKARIGECRVAHGNAPVVRIKEDIKVTQENSKKMTSTTNKKDKKISHRHSEKDSKDHEEGISASKHAHQVSLHRVHGRPLTAPSGPHLLVSATSGPSSCLGHINARIV